MDAVRPGLRTSVKAEALTESVIREMTRLALAHDAINLAQGFPDFPAPDEVKRAACAAIEADINQYSITWGSVPLREALGWPWFPARRCTVGPSSAPASCDSRSPSGSRRFVRPERASPPGVRAGARTGAGRPPGRLRTMLAPGADREHFGGGRDHGPER